ncbi:MAG: cupin domain-containing protein [Phycisphaerae bacterium]|jgi:quercetin dioxygenase-like cupin family protein
MSPQPDAYTFIPDLTADQQIPAKGVLSQTLYQGDDAKVVLFGFAAGEELSEHTASMPAMLHFLRGEARLTLGGDAIEARAGAWVHMPAHLKHSITARTPAAMLLILNKAAKT